MSNILKYYTNIFTLMFKLGFARGAETGGAYEAIKEASKDFISPSEWNKLKSKYQRKNPSDFQAALKRVYEEKKASGEQLLASKKINSEIAKLISDWNAGITTTTESTKKGLTQTKEHIESANPFNRRIKLSRPYMSGPDVTALLTYLNNHGYDTKGVHKFGPASKAALKRYQKEVIGLRHPDGIMDLNGTTMRHILKNMNGGGYSERNTGSRHSKETTRLVEHLSDIDKYLTAFNKVYGGKGELISRDNGILGIVSRLGGSSLTRLTRELKPNFSKVNKKALAKELGLSENSKKFKEGLVRTALIAAISAVVSGGSSLALELFGINYGENLRKGPEMRKILKALGKGNVDVKKEMRDVLLSKNTTVPGLNKIVDVLNNPNMDTANLKRFMKEVYQPNWFQDTFGIFLPKGYKKVEKLIARFEKTGTTKDAKAAVTEIYKLAHNAYRKAKINYNKAKAEYNSISKKLKSRKKSPLDILNGRSAELQEKYKDAEYYLSRARKELDKARAGLGKLGSIASRYTNLDAKRAQIQGEKFDTKKALAVEKQLDSELVRLYGKRRLRRVTEKLNSRQSFGYRVDVNKVNDPSYMGKLLTKMNKETINGKTSILAGVMRGVKQHYGIDFTVEEFTSAFMNTAQKTTSKYILSNLGRERNQKFQGKIKGNLFKIDLNGTPVYFKDSCTNIVTVVNDLITTVDSTSSVPIVWTVSTSSRGGNSEGLKSKPGEDETKIPGHTPQTPPPPGAPNHAPTPTPTQGPSEGFGS